MDDHNQTESFRYTYSAREQEEIKRIREKYQPEGEIQDKMEQLRALDRSVTGKASKAALTVGIFGTLLMGIGMSFAMEIMGVWFIPGIVIGIAGIALVACSYPLYCRILKKERERVAPRILQLTDDLMK